MSSESSFIARTPKIGLMPRFGPRLDLRQRLADYRFREFSVVFRLGAEPISLRRPKTAKTQVRIRGDGTLARNDLADALCRTPISLATRYCDKCIGSRNSSRKSSPGVTGFIFALFASINDSPQSRPPPAFRRPSKADSKLVVDANTVLTQSVTFQVLPVDCPAEPGGLKLPDDL